MIDDLKAERGAGIEERLISLEKSIKRLFALIDRLKEEINTIKIKESVRDLRDR